MTALRFFGTFLSLLALSLGTIGALVALRHRRNNRKCILGLLLAQVTWLAALFGRLYFAKNFGPEAWPMRANYEVLGGAAVALGLSILGVRERSRRRHQKDGREKYGTRRGWLGVGLSAGLLVLTMGQIYWTWYPSEPLKLYDEDWITREDLHFRFRAPIPWGRVPALPSDAPGSLVFTRTNPGLTFTILVENAPTKKPLNLDGLAELARQNLSASAPPATFENEQRETRRDLEMLTFEATALVRHEHRFYVYWLTIYRGCRYQLICSGPLREREAVRRELVTLVSSFEILRVEDAGLS